MGRRVGTASLPLHGGKAPAWLFGRMAALAPAVVEAMVLEHGHAVFLQRLSDPFWFQAFGCVLGFDWHSSGVTTTVCGALKEGLRDRQDELGIYVAGGKGKTSLKTPVELIDFGHRLGLDGEALAYNSRMSAKVDSAAVQDGFGIYHHSFFLTRDGQWAVVQQGMREADGSARRYHWLGSEVSDLVCEPHAAIASEARQQHVLNLVAAESTQTRATATEFARLDPARANREIAKVISMELPRRHWVDIEKDVNPKHLHKVLVTTYEQAPGDFEALLAIKGVGPAALRALALVSEVVYGAPASMKDPARFSFAHGGKDGTPFPVDRVTYDHTVGWLSDAVSKAKLGHTDRMHALRRLREWSDRP